MPKTLEVQIRVISKKLSRTSSQALTRIERYDWILFTSKNAVKFFVEEIRKRNSTLSSKSSIAAVGPETAHALRVAKLPVHAVPGSFTAREMIKSIGTVKGSRILFPRSAIAPHDVIRTLRKKGARVSVVPLYTTVAVPLLQVEKRRLLAGIYSQLRFKSPSGVQGLMKQLNNKEKEVIRKLSAECIGPTTARAVREAGFKRVSIKAVL